MASPEPKPGAFPGAICGACLLTLTMVFSFGASPALAQTTSDLVAQSALRVCADPANLPFSNERRQGFENKVADLIGKKLDLPVVYTWFPQATGFVRRTLRDRKCDIIMGFSQGHELVQNTNHYYRSTYVMVFKTDGKLKDIVNLDDPRLREARIGVVAGTPPATVLAMNQLLGRIKPYPLLVDRRHDSPAERMIADLEKDEIDIGLMWGPIGGYYAGKAAAKLTVQPMVKETKGPRMAYRITFGIRKGEPDWKHKLNDLIAANQSEINAILLEFGVPLLTEQDELIGQ